MAKDATRVRRRERKNIASGVAHVNSTFNNTMITITDAQGNAIAWSSAGAQGFKGSRKSTPFAAQVAAEDAGKKAQEHGMKTLEVEVRGPGSGRESALRALQSIGFVITSPPRIKPYPAPTTILRGLDVCCCDWMATIHSEGFFHDPQKLAGTD